MFTNVGNYSEYTGEITSVYPFPNDKKNLHKYHKEWDGKRYLDLPTVMMKIVCDACVKSGEDHLLSTNPLVIVERHQNILSQSGKVKNEFGIHSDRDGPAHGPCTSILYYYQIDKGIDDVGLHFYEWLDDDDIQVSSEKPIVTFTPISGDIITFGDNIPHCPGEFKTDSEIPRVRGVFAIFIKHPEVKKADVRYCLPCFPCLKY